MERCMVAFLCKHLSVLVCQGVGGVLGECWLEQTAVSSASPNTVPEDKGSCWIPAPSTADQGGNSCPLLLESGGGSAEPSPDPACQQQELRWLRYIFLQNLF